MKVRETYLGIIDGLATVEVANAETGEVIGYNQSAPVDDSDTPSTETQ
jgi:hypothetical protein